MPRGRPRKQETYGYVPPKIRGGEIVNRPKKEFTPTTIREINEDLIGKRVFFFHPTDGIMFITVKGLYKGKGRESFTKYGLVYEYEDEKLRVHQKTVWVRDQLLFRSRGACESWVKAMLQKSEADKFINRAKGLE